MDGRIETLQPILHYGGHWLVPFAIAWVTWRRDWLRNGAVIAVANAIDFDHVLATPMFDPDRCSIGFHLLHGWEAALAFTAMMFIPRWWARAFAIGALWHLVVDYGDCSMQIW